MYKSALFLFICLMPFVARAETDEMLASRLFEYCIGNTNEGRGWCWGYFNGIADMLGISRFTKNNKDACFDLSDEIPATVDPLRRAFIDYMNLINEHKGASPPKSGLAIDYLFAALVKYYPCERANPR